MNGLGRRVALLERATGAGVDEEDRAWDAALAQLTTDELRALVADLAGERLTDERAAHLASGLARLERAGGAPAEAARYCREQRGVRASALPVDDGREPL